MKNFIKFFLVTVLALSFATVNAESNTTSVSNGDIDPEGGSACLDLTMSLRYKDNDAKTNGQISQLQDFLVSQGYMTGNPTGYFGLVTFGAVKKFQSQYGFSPTGFVGTLTRGKVKDITCNGNGGTISMPPIPVTPTNPSDRLNSNNNLPKGCTSNTLFNPLTGERCVEVRSVGSFTITPNFVNKTIELGEKFEQAFSVKTDYDEQKDGRYFTWILGKGSMPEGLSLSNTEGWRTIVSGTPKTKGAYSFTVEAYSIQNKERVASSLVYLNVGPSTSSTQQPYISMVAGKSERAGNFEVDAGSPAYISGSNLSNVSVSVGGKLAEVTQKGDSYIYATMPSDLVPGQTYDLYVFNAKGAVSGPISNVVKVKVLSKMTSTSPTSSNQQPTIYSISPNQGSAKTEVTLYGANLSGAGTIEFYNSKGQLAGTLVPSYVSNTSVSFVISGLLSENISAGIYQVGVVTNACAGGCNSNRVSFNLNSSGSTSSTQPSITVLSPNGGEQWYYGSVYNVTWRSTDIRRVSLWACSNVGICARVLNTPAMGVTNNGSYSLTTSQLPFSGSMKIRVASEDNYPSSTVYDDSNDYFTAIGPATSTQPITYHPADTNKDGRITLSEVNTYGMSYGNSSNYKFADALYKRGEYYSWSNSSQMWIDASGRAVTAFDISSTSSTQPTTTVYPTKIALISPSHAKVGDQVTITGMDFNKTALNTIKLRNVSSGQVTNLSFNTYSEVQLSFSVPAGLSVGEYALSVNNNKNTVDSNSVAFWVDPTPTASTSARPVISSINPSSALVGAPIVLSGTGFNTAKNNIIIFKNSGTSEQSAINYVAESESSLKLFVPPIAPGSYEITVMNQIVDAFSNVYKFTINAPSTSASSASASVPVSLSASLLSSTDDRAGAWGNFGPGKGTANQNSADWNWSATLNLPSSVTVSAIRMDRDSFGEHWSTDRSTDYPLVVVENGSQLNSVLGQTISLSAGTHNLKIYGQKEDQNFQGSTLIVLFSDGSSIKATISPIVSFMQTGDYMMTANMFDSLKNVNPNLYR